MRENNFLYYTDDRLIISGEIIKYNNVLCLRFTARGATSNEQELSQHIPVEFLSNFQDYMFRAVFKK